MVKTKKHTFKKHIISRDRFFPQTTFSSHFDHIFPQQSAELRRRKLKNIYPWYMKEFTLPNQTTPESHGTINNIGKETIFLKRF